MQYKDDNKMDKDMMGEEPVVALAVEIEIGRACGGKEWNSRGAL